MSTELALQEGRLPAYLNDYQGPSGTEDLDQGDVTIPRLKIAQSMTPEVKDDTLEEGALYLNVDASTPLWTPGQEPLKVTIVARNKEYILWRPRKDNNGGVLARARAVNDKGVVRYAWDKPNTSFEVKVEGKIKAVWKTGQYIDEDGLAEWGSEIPNDAKSGIAATVHHNYVVVIGDTVALLSMSRSGVKKAKDLNALLKMDRKPIQAKVFALSTVDESSDGNRYKNWSIKPAGYVQSAELFTYYTELAESFRTASFAVEQPVSEEAPF